MTFDGTQFWARNSGSQPLSKRSNRSIEPSPNLEAGAAAAVRTISPSSRMADKPHERSRHATAGGDAVESAPKDANASAKLKKRVGRNGKARNRRQSPRAQTPEKRNSLRTDQTSGLVFQSNQSPTTLAASDPGGYIKTALLPIPAGRSSAPSSLRRFPLQVLGGIPMFAAAILENVFRSYRAAVGGRQ